MKKHIANFLVMIICIANINVILANSANIPNDVVTYNNHSYKVYDLGMTWEEAENYCESLGGHLVTITSEEEQKTIETLLNSKNLYNYWIGGYYSENEFKWDEAFEYLTGLQESQIMKIIMKIF